MTDKYVLLLDFSSGIIEPLPLSAEVLSQDRIVIAIDELKERVWLWEGAETSLVERRAAQRKARSLVSAGYQLGHIKIGRDVEKIEIIEGDILDDPEFKQAYDSLLHTLNQKFKITDQVLGRISGTPTPAPVTTTPRVVSSPTASSTSAKPIDQPTPKTATTTEPEIVAPKPSRELHDLGIVRVGILIASILDFFPMCYVNVTKHEDGTLYTVEDPDGIICEIDVKVGSVNFLKRYDFRGKRKEILTLLRDRLATADL